MGVCVGTAVFLTADMSQQRKFEQEPARLIEELRQSADHVRRLKEFVTFCAWTGRVQWQGRWVSVEQFLDERFGLNVSHGISDEAIAMLRRTLPRSEPPADDTPKPPVDPA